MRKRIYTVVGLLTLVALSCAREKPPLDVHEVLGSTPEELQARWGDPHQNVEDPGVSWKYGHMLWLDVRDTGVRVWVVIRRGKASYVSYRFEAMEPFDELAAFRMIGVEVPDAEPQLMTTPGARRWEPFEDYDKMTLNPHTKFISIGSDPIRLTNEQAAELGLEMK